MINLFESDAIGGRKTYFVDVILPLPIPNTFTYRVPLELNDHIKLGCRTVVQFGKKKILTAIIARIHESPPKVYEAKMILSVLDEQPVINRIQLDFFAWMAEYYMCHTGEVLNAALPAGLKISSESRIQLHPSFTIQLHENWSESGRFSDTEITLLQVLSDRESMTYTEVSDMLQIKNVYQYITSLAKKEAVIIFEEVKEKYKPKILKKVRLSRKYAADTDALQYLLSQLEKKPKQQDLVLRYLQLVPVFKDATLNESGVIRSTLLSDEGQDGFFRTLIKNGVFEPFEIVISRLDESGFEGSGITFSLSEAQTKARDQILNQFDSRDIVLLHGITGSGKTEIYIDLIQKSLDQGNQALLLLPEIALTTQIVARLYKVFGSQLGIYHSKYSDNERVEVWQGIISGKIKVIVGVRSSIFLPFDQLGLIIVDEEHETSYKQYDPAPRYNARDCALVLGKRHNCKILLGSATPAIESYYNAHQGKWGLVTLPHRYGNAQLPDIQLVDTKVASERKQMQQDFSQTLLDEIQTRMTRKEQTILFQNRRGYAPYLSCESCGFVPQCKSCDVSLTYHLYKNELSCHYCGHHERIPSVCPACGSSKIKPIGFGTEKLEEEIQILLPNAKTIRMDLDTTRSKHGYQKIIHAFEHGDVDILIGTQMVTKGLDFDKVTLVGVFDIDRMIHFPDFRSNERVFQLLTQVSGRAGRKEAQGKVIIQTNNPKHPVFEKVLTNDYSALYTQEITEREKYFYPPFSRLIRITLKAEDKIVLENAASLLASELKTALGGHRILGPEPPIIDKIRNMFLKDIYLKFEKDKIDIKKAKDILKKIIQEMSIQKTFKSIQMVVDVDVL